MGAIVNFAVALSVSQRVTAEPPQEVQDLVEHIRVPAGSAAIAQDALNLRPVHRGLLLEDPTLCADPPSFVVLSR